MKKYELTFFENGEAAFVNPLDSEDFIIASNILRFGTVWTPSKSQFIDVISLDIYDNVNCFFTSGYQTTFCSLSNCGEELTVY
jgi:hypothetical protein